MTQIDLNEIYEDSYGLAADLSGCHEETALLDSAEEEEDMRWLQLMDDKTENAAEHYDDVSRSVILTGQYPER